jgi:hypothetical protein
VTLSKKSCHAIDCPLQVPVEMLMCRRHWFMVPKPLRDEVWAAYRAGDGTAWQAAADGAAEVVRQLETSVTIIYSCVLGGPAQAKDHR